MDYKQVELQSVQTYSSVEDGVPIQVHKSQGPSFNGHRNEQAEPLEAPSDGVFTQEMHASNDLKEIVNTVDDDGHGIESTPGGMSTFGTIVTFLKCLVGTGILYQPYMFSVAGLWYAVMIFTLVAFLSTWNMLLLLQCHTSVAKNLELYPSSRSGKKSCSSAITMATLGYDACGRVGLWAVNMSTLLSQLGYCTAYFIYVTRNLNQLFGNIKDGEEANAMQWLATPQGLITAQLAIYIPLALVRQLKYFHWPNVIGNCCIWGGLMLVSYYICTTLATTGVQPIQEFNPTGALLYLGSAAVVFEGIVLVLPLREATAKKEQYPKVLVSVMTGLAIFFLLFSAGGYLAFGANTQTFVTLNVPETCWIGVAVKLMYCLAVVFTYPLMLFPAVQVLERLLMPKLPTGVLQRWAFSSLRVVTVFVTLIVSIAAGQCYDKFMALIGALCACPLALVYPPLIYIRIHWSNMSYIAKAREVLNLSVGMMFLIVCTYTTLMT
eukprot:CAMPEP_0113936204 /NCGR_PEP_ID=MMETSP1339-20121228/3165_1 /TAXON_ID=94617 /ORGANISM="Fibrocapsa japonica" /LENGTH=492 /DNA_ID=CAMNT_0000938589 /DNA_START=83 /DNA_END=1561 /DNA_ORIENTATION=+ /assembly_acc=CAM_ASM_000762